MPKKPSKKKPPPPDPRPGSTEAKRRRPWTPTRRRPGRSSLRWRRNFRSPSWRSQKDGKNGVLGAGFLNLWNHGFLRYFSFFFGKGGFYDFLRFFYGFPMGFLKSMVFLRSVFFFFKGVFYFFLGFSRGLYFFLGGLSCWRVIVGVLSKLFLIFSLGCWRVLYFCVFFYFFVGGRCMLL